MVDENQQTFKVQKAMELKLYRINMNQDICFTWTIKVKIMKDLDTAFSTLKIRSVGNPLNLYVIMPSLRNLQKSLWQSLMNVSMRMNTNQAENSSLIKKSAPFILRKYSL